MATILTVLGQVAGDVSKLIEDAETADQAFERLAAVDIAGVLYRSATAFASVRRLLELRAAATKVP